MQVVVVAHIDRRVAKEEDGGNKLCRNRAEKLKEKTKGEGEGHPGVGHDSVKVRLAELARSYELQRWKIFNSVVRNGNGASRERKHAYCVRRMVGLLSAEEERDLRS